MDWKRVVFWIGGLMGLGGMGACQREEESMWWRPKAPEVYIYYPHAQAEMSQLASTDTVLAVELRVGRTGVVRADCDRLVVEADELVYDGSCEDQGIYFWGERTSYSPLGEQGGTRGMGVTHRLYVRFRREGRFQIRVVASFQGLQTQVFSPVVEVNNERLEGAARTFLRDYWTRPMPPEEVHVVDDETGQFDQIRATVDYLGRLGLPIRFLLDHQRVPPFIIYHPPGNLAARGACFDPRAQECHVWLGTSPTDWERFHVAVHETLHVLGIWEHPQDKSVMDITINTQNFSTLWVHPYIQKAAHLKRRGF